MSLSTTSGYRQCQSLIRGLDLLALMNQNPGGSASISELAVQTGIHRTTVKRLLETLKDMGYVSHESATNLYRLAFRVQQLSYGFRDAVSLVEDAWPEMYALSKQIVWPCALLVPEGDEMVVRASTRLYSRLSFHPGMPGRRLPMLSTAAGRAYLASVPDAERTVIMRMIQGRMHGDPMSNAENDHLDALVVKTRSRGYALNLGEWEDEPRFGGVAVPLRSKSGVLAVMNIIFVAHAVNEREELPLLVSALQEAAGKIEAKIAV